MEPKIWVTSDWHLGHDKEFVWKSRGFESVDAMDEKIVELHNMYVNPGDDVYVLGDLMLGSDVGLSYIGKMNGNLHIIRGNHDSNKRIENYAYLHNIVGIHDALYLKHKKHHFYLSHYPTLTGNLEKESLKQMTLNLFGHTHQKENFYEDKPFMYHVGVDSHRCRPVLLDDIIEEMYEKQREEKEKESLLAQPAKEGNTEISQAERFSLYYHKHRDYEQSYCARCVWHYTQCGGPSLGEEPGCPNGITYKRDPPDGGYYG